MINTPEPPRVYRSTMRRASGTIKHPKRGYRQTNCLCAYIVLNGTKAYALFDSGSTTDSVSPNFTRVANLPVLELEEPVTLQLGCAGSLFKINYGIETNLEFASISDPKMYLDVANLDKYDVILGTLFLSEH